MHTIAIFHIAIDDLEPVAGGVQNLTPRAFCHILGPHCTLYPIPIPGPFTPFLVFD